MAKITVPELDAHGVVVDQDRSGSISGQLTKAQNAIADPLGEKGSIHKRPGLKAINGTAGNGTVRGGIGVPISLGSAGPVIVNPFGSNTATIASITEPITRQPQQLGATFNDESFAFRWDWTQDFSERDYEDLLTSIYGVGADLFDVSGTGRNPIDLTQALDTSELALTPLTHIGDTSGNWFLALDHALAVSTNSGTTYTNAPFLVFPTGKMILPSVMVFNVANGGGSAAQYGRRACLYNNRVYYTDGNYTVDTNDPIVRVYDGFTDEVAFVVPRTTSSPVRHVTTIFAAPDNYLYFTTLDSGTPSSSTGVGSVYQYAPATGAIVQLTGAALPTDQIPKQLCWYLGRLWIGTASQSSSARVYWIRPGIDTAFTLDLTLAAGRSGVGGMAVFQGNLYCGVYNRTLSGNVELKKRTSLDVWSDEDTGTANTSAGNIGNRAYFDVVVWPPEDSGITSPAPTLYATRRADEDTWPNFGIRRLSGGTWSTVTTGALGIKFQDTWVQSGTSLVPALWVASDSAATTPFRTLNGTTWVNESGNISGISGTSYMLPQVFIEAAQV